MTFVMAESFMVLNVADRRGLDLSPAPTTQLPHTSRKDSGVTQTLQNKTTKLRIYIARLQGAILCYVFLYVFCFDFIFVSFTFYFGHNQGCKYKNIQHSRFIAANLTSPSRSHVRGKTKKKSKVMCNASYMCMCALSHMCMLTHIQKCPVTLIMNPVPPVVCKEIESYPSYSHDMTRYT